MRISILAVAIGAMVWSQTARAGFFQISDGNSFAQFDPNPAQGLEEFGLYEWAVDEVEVLHTLNLTTAGTTDTNFDGSDDTLFLLYTHSNFTIGVRFAPSLLNKAISSATIKKWWP